MTWAFIPPQRCGGWRSWLFHPGRAEWRSGHLRILGFTFWWTRLK